MATVNMDWNNVPPPRPLLPINMEGMYMVTAIAPNSAVTQTLDGMYATHGFQAYPTHPPQAQYLVLCFCILKFSNLC